MKTLYTNSILRFTDKVLVIIDAILVVHLISHIEEWQKIFILDTLGKLFDKYHRSCRRITPNLTELLDFQMWCRISCYNFGNIFLKKLLRYMFTDDTAFINRIIKFPESIDTRSIFIQCKHFPQLNWTAEAICEPCALASVKWSLKRKENINQICELNLQYLHQGESNVFTDDWKDSFEIEKVRNVWKLL